MGSGAICKVSQEEEGSPEASLGRVVVQRWGDRWKHEANRALRPGKVDGGLGAGEWLSGQWVVDGVDIAGCAGTYGHEDLGFCCL